MKLLFCHIGWMERYEGRRGTGDKITGGGAYVDRNGHGGEVCNFLKANDGYVYGHVETIKGDEPNQVDRQINLTTLGPVQTGDYADGVTVIWTATHPKEGGRRVVGWYRNARVFRKRQEIAPKSDQHRKDKIRDYRIRASASDVTLLLPDERDLALEKGRGWMGQTNWWFPKKTTDGVPDFLARLELRMGDEEVERSDLPKASIQERGNYRLHKRIERNSTGAQQAKQHHGYTCQACDFKFEDKFGEIGKDFIEAHHLKPLSKIKAGQIVTYDIATDFAVLCSNCHRMIHRTDDPSDLVAFRRHLRRISREAS